MSKADYVRSEAAKHPSHATDDFARHTCHWPDCGRHVPPAMWGCKVHWFKLPMRLRNRIWATYRPGQEISKTPSAEYLAVAREVQDWIALAIATEARRAETVNTGSVHEGAGPQDIAQTPSPSSRERK